MNLPELAVTAINKLYNANKNLANGTDDERRTLTKFIAEQLAYDLGLNWGTKASSSTSPQSKDAIAYFNGQGMDVWDWQNGTTREPQVRIGQEPTYPNITDQYFIHVLPINHTGGTVIPPIEPPANNDEVLSKLTTLLSKMGEVQTQMNQLNSQFNEVISQLGTVNDHLVIIENNPRWVDVKFPNYSAKLLGMNIVLKPS